MVKNLWWILLWIILSLLNQVYFPAAGKANQTAKSDCAQQTGPYMQTAGSQFCFGGQSVQIYGSTMYPYWVHDGETNRGSGWTRPNFTEYIDLIFKLAQDAKLNTIRPTDYLSDVDKWDDPIVWKNMDYLIDQAQKHRFWIILDISAFRHWLTKHNVTFVYNPDDWLPFIQFVTARYRDSTAVSQYSVAGEIRSQKNGGAKPDEYIKFFSTIEEALYKADGGRHLISVGGLSYLNFNSGIPWQALYGLPYNNMAAIHVYSQGDRNITVPMVSDWAKAHDKPFIIEEFGFKQQLGDAQRADAYQDVISWGRAHNVAGIIFSNMGPEVASTSYEVSDATPLTWAVIRNNAP